MKDIVHKKIIFSHMHTFLREYYRHIENPRQLVWHSVRQFRKISNAPSCEHVDGQCDLDFWPTNLNINRLPPVTTWHVCTKIHLDSTFRSYDFVRKQNKYQIFVLFLEVVTLTFVLQTSISIGFLLSPSGMCNKFHLDLTFRS